MSDDVELVEGSVELSTLGSDPVISSLVATAHAYPRPLKKVMQDCRDMVTMSPDFAAGCFFKLPRTRKDDKTGREVPIEGPSIRLAEVIASNWTNLHIRVSPVPEDPHERGRVLRVKAEAFDGEKNYAVSIEVSRRTTTKQGRPYGDDMRQVTAAAATSIAFRNAIFRIVPRGIVDELYLLAKEAAVGTQEQIAESIRKAFVAFSKMGISEERVLAALECETQDQITREDVATLRSWHVNIREKTQNVDDIFPPPGQAQESPADLKTSLLGRWMVVLEDGSADVVPEDEAALVAASWNKANKIAPKGGDLLQIGAASYVFRLSGQ